MPVCGRTAVTGLAAQLQDIVLRRPAEHAQSKERAAALLAQIGFDPVDAGPLRIARLAEPFGMLATALAYGHVEGPKWVYHFNRLK